MSSAGSPRELLGVVESGGCARCFGTSSRPSAWPWQLLSTTVLVRRKRWRCSRTAPHGDRRPPPGPGRRWSTRRTTAHGHRRLHLRGCGRAVSLSPGRRGATAACGAPQGKLLSWVCHRWRTLRLKPSMVAPSDTSSRRTLRGRSLRRRKRRRGTRRGLRRLHSCSRSNGRCPCCAGRAMPDRCSWF